MTFLFNRLLILLFLQGPLWALAQHDFDSLYAASASFRDSLSQYPDGLGLYGSEKPMRMVIASDFKDLYKQKEENYQPASLRLFLNDSIAVTREVKIKPRGNYRRQYCRFPPMMIKFLKKEERLDQLQEFNKLKMVVDCGKNAQYEQYLLNEYLVYKLYNLLTDYSFKVRLLQVTYIDSSGKYDSEDRFAFIIENEEQMASRQGGFVLKIKNIHQDSLDYAQINQLAVFQFLIGNTDWSVPALHNIKVVKSLKDLEARPVAVPYDFDYSGMVNAVYAKAPEQLGIETVRDRLFRGFCRSEAEMEACFDLYREKKEQIYALYQEPHPLEDGYRKQCIKYLDEFYEIIGDPGLVKRFFLDPCKSR